MLSPKANGRRGETVATIKGRDYTLRVTLGALAEIGAALGVDELGGLDARFEKLSFADLIVILGALLRGGGHEVSDDDVHRMQIGVNEAGAWIAEAFRTSRWSVERNRPARFWN